MAEIKPDPVEVKDAENFDEPLIVVNNPFKRILKWLYDIRKRQTTKFSINLNIPLLPFILAVAIVVATVLVFAFGTGLKIGQISITRDFLLQPSPIVLPSQPVSYISPNPTPYKLSKIGVIKSTYQYSMPSPSEMLESTVSGLEIRPTDTVKPLRYILMETNGNYVLLTSSTVDFKPFVNERVLATGMYDSESNTLDIDSSNDLEILP